MRNIDELTAGLKAGECVLFNENGWNIVDDLGITYEKEDWGFMASLV